MEEKIEVKLIVADVCGLDMLKVWRAGVWNYQPMCGGVVLEEEAGVTDISLRNMVMLVRLIGPQPAMCRYQQGRALFEWRTPRQALFVATGFGCGYGGTGPSGFARVLSSFGCGTIEQVKRQVMAVEFRGVFTWDLNQPTDQRKAP